MRESTFWMILMFLLAGLLFASTLMVAMAVYSPIFLVITYALWVIVAIYWAYAFIRMVISIVEGNNK